MNRSEPQDGLSGIRPRDAIVMIAGAVLILFPAFINGFPFVYPDTGTYLAAAFRGEVPVDRPYWYGVFMRITSLGGHSFWGIIAGQALLCSSYILRTVAMLVERRAYTIALVIIAFLSAISSLGWYAGQLMPDIFTGVGILAMFHFLLGRGARWTKVLDGSAVVFCCWVHLSNLLILPLSGALLLLVHRHALAGEARRKWLVLSGLSLISWGGLAAANRIVDREFHLSRGGHAFLVARMVDTGMLHAWLEEHCADGEYRLCAYKDRLPSWSGAFLWTDSISPLHLEGGWLATKPEYDRIIRSTLTEPRYLGWHVRASVASTLEELTRWTICVGLENKVYRTPESPPYFMIEGTIRSGLKPYLASLQNGGRGELAMAWPDRFYAFLTIGSVLLAAILIVWPRFLAIVDRRVRGHLLFALGSVFIGCWVCATLAVVDDRYLARTSWLVPLFVGIMVARAISARWRTPRPAPPTTSPADPSPPPPR